MDNTKIGCSLIVLVAILAFACAIFYPFRSPEPLFVVRVSKPVPTATPNVFHQVILEQARTDNEVKLMVIRHELRKEWALFVVPLAIIGLGGYCLITAWRKWLSS